MAGQKADSIRRKQSRALLLTSTVALVLACAGFFAHDQMTFRSATKQRLQTLAEVLGKNCSVAVDYDKRSEAMDLLQGLEAEPSIVAATVYTSQGTVFATYPPTSNIPPATAVVVLEDAHWFERDRLVLLHQIRVKDEVVGAIRLESTLPPLARRLVQYFVIAGVVMLLSLLTTSLLAAWLQRMILQPLLRLVEATRAVSRQKNYALRVPKESHDELGRLIDDFNEMLAQIQVRDTALQQAQAELEQRVLQRTRDLEAEIGERKRAEAALKRNSDRLEVINRVLLTLGPEHDENLNRLTALCGEMLGATCALYNRLEGSLLCSLGQWQTPPGFQPRDSASGHICCDVIQRNSDDAVLITDLQHSPYADSDPNVRTFGLQTYFGQAVRHQGRAVGSICVVYQSEFQPSEDDRRILGIVASAIGNEDERKQADKQLRLSQERLRASIEHTPNVAVQWHDETGRVLFWNRASERIYGWTAQEAVGRRLDELMLMPEEALNFQKSLQRIRNTGQPVGPVEFPMRRRDGSSGVCLSTVFLIPSADESPCFVCMDVDITEQRRTETALKQSEAELLSIYQHAPAMMFLVERDGKVHRANRTALEFSGSDSRGTLPSHPCQALRCAGLLEGPTGQCVSPTCRACQVTRLLHATFDTGQPSRRVETHLQVRRGSSVAEVTLLASTARLHVADQQMVLLCLEDVSDRRRLEDQLRQSQKMEAVGQLAGGVAHDFNNILTAVLMQLSLLRDQIQAGVNVQPMIEDLERGVNRAAGLTRQLLLFSRRQPLQRRTLDLNETLSQVTELLRRLLGEHIELLLHTDGEKLWVDGDTGMMEQLVMNLCVNARDAMPQGGRLGIHARNVEIGPANAQAHPEGQPGIFVCLSVADTGCGIDSATLNRIFEPFFTTKEVGKGTGLGLATVYGIVKQHMGWVEVESEVGRGTTFHVYLPAASPPTTDSAKAEPNRPAGRQETILLVEDDEAVRTAAMLCLESLGYRVISAADGQEAIQRWTEHRGEVDLLFTDMVMPLGMNGLQLLAHLRRIAPDLKAIISSGYSLDLAQPSTPAGTGVAFLPKPYKVSTLATVVRESLEKN